MSHNGFEFAAELAVVGLAVVGLAVVGLAVVGLAVVGLAVVGLAVVGLAVVGLAEVGLAVVHVTPLRHKLVGPHWAGRGHSTTPFKLHSEGRQTRNKFIKKRSQKH
jgi:hypothetical protein